VSIVPAYAGIIVSDLPRSLAWYADALRRPMETRSVEIPDPVRLERQWNKSTAS
jgi:hypothetical protein